MFIVLLLVLATGFFFRLAFLRGKGTPMWAEPPEVSERHARLTDQVAALRQRCLRVRSEDGLTLMARYFPAKNPSAMTVILSHGYRGTGLHDHAHNVLYYHGRGMHVLLPDHRGHGGSEGAFICFGCHESGDLLTWCRFARTYLGAGKILLHGVSMGASAALMAAADASGGELSGVISDCAFTSGREMFDYIAQKMLHLPRFPLVAATLLAAKLFCRCDLTKNTPLDAAGKIKTPLLILHGEKDNFVPTRMAHALHIAAPASSLLLFKNAAHGASSEIAPDQFYGAIDRFIAALPSAEN